MHCFCNKQFQSCFEPCYDSEVKCKVFIMKISLLFIQKKIHTKSFVLSLASVMRLIATWKWPIY